MTIKDRFQRIRDYVDSQNIVDTLETYFMEDELKEYQPEGVFVRGH